MDELLRQFRWSATAIGLLAVGFAQIVLADDATPVDFVRDVRPILQRSCQRCHGAEKQKGDYRLDVRQSALHNGESYAPNIIPGKADDSPLIKFVTGDGDVVMPPEGKPLTAAEVRTLRQWIDQGAKWPDDVAGELKDKSDWWSLRPLSLKDHFAGNLSIDHFIRAKLTAAGLRPAIEADRLTLIRRVSFDLIGLPPTPEEVSQFVGDVEPNAYERLVDRLLDSPRFGERWARHWLDAAHFAETHGHDQDRIREHAWPYRDYLIQSLNADKPYGQLIQEQVAGDVLYPDDPQATVALGFLAAGPWDESSLKDIREDTLDRQIARYLDRDDMIATVINNVSGLTVQCARCHDHKFDPISQADYYALQAVFSGVERANRSYDPDVDVGTRRRTLLKRKLQLQQKSAEFVATLLSPAHQQLVGDWEHKLGTQGAVWKPVEPESWTSSDGATLTRLPDGSVLSGGTRPDKDTVTIIAAVTLPKVTAVKLEVLNDDSLPHRGPGRQDNGNLHLSEFEVYIDGSDTRLELVNPRADFDQQDWGIARAIDKSEPTAWGIYPKVSQPHAAAFELREPLNVSGLTKLRFVLKQRHGGGHLIGRARLMISDATPPVRLDLLPEPIAAILATRLENRTEQQRVELTLFQMGEEVDRELSLLPKPSLVYTAAAEFEPQGGLVPPPGPRPIQILHRGDIKQPRDPALPGALECVTGLPSRFDVASEAPESARRAALARWLTDPKNPLTWRVIVNRVWHHHFGRGLVGTLNDFGHMGELPTHPELLDWLASEFRDGDQSLKKLHRQIVTSATYRQSVHAMAEAPIANLDPENRLLSHMNRTRLDAECLRDAVLQASGRLDLRMGGPSDRQFDLQSGIHVTPKVDYTKFNLDSDLGRRRSIYRFLFRTLPDPFMETLDCPSGDQITPVRTNSVTVQQALALWNDVFIARNCEHIAARVEGETNSSQASDAELLRKRVDRTVELILCRRPTDDERIELTAYAMKHGLANVCRLLLNSNEFLFVN
ncbi:MAG: PSD1 domain-containing protein [Planctomycetes bacterium]|nr:PSD1 domain-containing protein [Planctomycetota bacterium]